MNTQERIQTIINSLHIEHIDKEIIKLQLEALVMQAQLETLRGE